MKNVKWIILALLIILIIFIILLMMALNIQQEGNTNTDNKNTQGTDSVNNVEATIQKTTDGSKFYTVEQSINQYLDVKNTANSVYYGYNENNEYVQIITNEEINQYIYELLSDEYIKQNNITLDNINDFVQTDNQNTIFLVLDMYELSEPNEQVYAVYGIEYTLDNQYIRDGYYKVYLDTINKTFAIEPLNLQSGADLSQIELVNNDNITIEKTNFNQYITETVNDEYISKKYINSYKVLSLARPDIMYEMLDYEYRNAKFGSLEAFQSYIESKETEISTIKLQQYQVTNEEEGYKQYVCIDQNEKYYIFRATGIMDYTVILDTYTIDLPEFIEKYNNGTDDEKVALNLQKIFSAINSKDYQYVYNKLDSTFKQNNFPTLADFETYAENTFYDNNSLGYTNYQTSGNLHIYELKITDKSNATSQAITKNFIMQLLDGTDFVMSFSV